MNIKQLIDKISDNWIAKLICFVIAVMVFVFHKISLLESKSFVVPLEVISDGLVSPVSSLPDNVKVNVKVNSENLASIGANGISAFIDLTHITEKGHYKIPVTLKVSDALMLMDPLEISVSPEYMELSVDRKIEKYIPLSPSLTGEPEFGFAIKNVELSPSSVKVIGPSEAVSKITHIDTGKIIVKGAAKGFSSQTNIDNIYSNVKVEDVPEIKVTVDIQPLPSSKKIEQIKIIPKNLKENLEITNPLSFISVAVSGTMVMINSITEKSISVFADCSAIESEGEWSVPVDIKLPSGVQLVSQSVEKISVSVSHKQLESDKNKSEQQKKLQE